MRIISQNRKHDVSYELTEIRITNNHIVAYMAGVNKMGTLMAEYSAPENAEKAMEMLHKAYIEIMPSLVIDKNAEFDSESMKVLHESTRGAIIRPANHDDVEFHMLPRIFRFPADEEIEVDG